MATSIAGERSGVTGGGRHRPQQQSPCRLTADDRLGDSATVDRVVGCSDELAEFFDSHPVDCHVGVGQPSTSVCVTGTHVQLGRLGAALSVSAIRPAY
jgi:hypothetical protein